MVIRFCALVAPGVIVGAVAATLIVNLMDGVAASISMLGGIQ